MKERNKKYITYYIGVILGFMLGTWFMLIIK